MLAVDGLSVSIRAQTYAPVVCIGLEALVGVLWSGTDCPFDHHIRCVSIQGHCGEEIRRLLEVNSACINQMTRVLPHISAIFPMLQLAHCVSNLFHRDDQYAWIDALHTVSIPLFDCSHRVPIRRHAAVESVIFAFVMLGDAPSADKAIDAIADRLAWWRLPFYFPVELARGGTQHGIRKLLFLQSLLASFRSEKCQSWIQEHMALTIPVPWFRRDWITSYTRDFYLCRPTTATQLICGSSRKPDLIFKLITTWQSILQPDYKRRMHVHFASLKQQILRDWRLFPWAIFLPIIIVLAYCIHASKPVARIRDITFVFHCLYQFIWWDIWLLYTVYTIVHYYRLNSDWRYPSVMLTFAHEFS